MLNKSKIELHDLLTGMKIVDQFGKEGIIFRGVDDLYEAHDFVLRKGGSWDRLKELDIYEVYVPNHPFAISNFYSPIKDMSDDDCVKYTLYWKEMSDEEKEERALYEKLKAKYACG